MPPVNESKTDLIPFPNIIRRREPTRLVASAVRLTELVGQEVLVGRDGDGRILLVVGGKTMSLSETQWYRWNGEAAIKGDPFTRLANKIKDALK
jgi:hypothetical protein